MTQALVTREQPPTRSPQQQPAQPNQLETVSDLRRAAAQLGQIDIGDRRWAELEPVLDTYLREAVRRSHDPRTAVWRTIIDDPDSPLVVKLRTFGFVLGSLNRSAPSTAAPAA